jgi:hypothetical protein
METNWSSRSSSGGEEPAAHLRRRRTSRSQEQVQEVKDKLAAKPGGVGKPEASYHQQQATEAVHSTIIAQLQATGRNPASTSLLVHVSSMSCYWISPQFGKDMLCPNSSLGNMIKSLSLHFTGTSHRSKLHCDACAGYMSYRTCTSNTQSKLASSNK